MVASVTTYGITQRVFDAQAIVRPLGAGGYRFGSYPYFYVYQHSDGHPYPYCYPYRYGD